MHSLTSRDSHNPFDQGTTRKDWRRWARKLHRLGLAKLAAAFLESSGAFSTLAAQTLFISQPLLEPWASKEGVNRLADLLEDPGQSAAFRRVLEEEAQ
ncbi:MAG: hypothetical protein WD740_04285 [Anaerolineales bacterium]